MGFHPTTVQMVTGYASLRNSKLVDTAANNLTSYFVLLSIFWKSLKCPIKMHRLHAPVHVMRPVATDVARSVVCLSVCVLATRVSCAKTAEPIEMPF